jgi:hypothetical protein
VYTPIALVPSLVVITDRSELGALWLPWCVDRERPAVPLQIDREPHRHAEARQLRVVDLEDLSVRTALAAYPRDDGGFILDAIVAIADEHRAGTRSSSHRLAQAFEVPQGLVLCEGSHRACALWESGLVTFDMLVRVIPLQWPQYRPAEMRAQIKGGG